MSNPSAIIEEFSPTLLVEKRGAKLLLTMNRPEARNALNVEMRRALTRAIAAYECDDDLRVAIVSGAGDRAFSAGADLKEVAAAGEVLDPTARDEAGVGILQRKSMFPFEEFDHCPKPIIAAIDGYALGAGLELAVCCDVRIATNGSVLGLPEPRWGMIPGPGIVHLSRLIPLGEALRMHLTGTPISAERAYQIGLVNVLADSRSDLTRLADEMADQIVACSPSAVRYSKKIVKDGRALTVDAQWALAETFSAAITQSLSAGQSPSDFAAEPRGT